MDFPKQRLRALGFSARIQFALLATTACLQAADPVVSNVRAVQRPGTQLVDITYDVADPDSATLAVSVSVSDTGGATYAVSASSFTGDVGNTVAPGTNKRITWDAGRDWPGRFSANMRFKVTAQDTAPAPAGMLPVPAGSFQMGDTIGDGYSDERPVHTVTLSAFYMDRTEVTKALWDEVYQWAIARPAQLRYSFDNPGLGKAANHPVHTVNWYDAVKWCNARSEREGLIPCYYRSAGQSTVYRSGELDVQNTWVKWTANGYRLPTEAEWEKAARGGPDGHRFPWMNVETVSHTQGNYRSWASDPWDVSPTRGYHPTYAVGQMPYTSPASCFAANGYGLYDMAGNISEWCWDWHDGAWYGNSASTLADTHGPASSVDGARLCRGGAWISLPGFSVRCASRPADSPGNNGFSEGFRCVKNLIGSSGGSTVAVESPRFALNLEGLAGGLTVQGRIRDALTWAFLSGVSVALAGRESMTSVDGAFWLANVSLLNGNTLNVGKSGYATHSETIGARPGASSLVVPDILLQPTPPSGKPVVTSLKPKYEGLFLAGVPVDNKYVASVNWNGNAPGTVRFFANELLIAEVPGVGPEYSAIVPVSNVFSPSLRRGANRIAVVAGSAGGVESEAALHDVSVIPLPPGLLGFGSGLVVQVGEGQVDYALDFDYPDPPLGAPVTLPVLGKFGGEFSVNGSFDYTLPDGTWEATLGYAEDFKQGKRGRHPTIPGLARYPKLHLYVGNKKLAGSVAARLSGTALPSSGITFDEISAAASIGGEFELGRFGVVDIFIPGSSEALSTIPGLKDAVSTLQAVVYAQPEVAGTVSLGLSPNLHFRDGELTGIFGVEAAYEPRLLGIVDARFLAGGTLSLALGIPNGEFRHLAGRLYGDAEFHCWLFSWNPDPVIFAEVNITNPLTAQGRWSSLFGPSLNVLAHGSRLSNDAWRRRPMSRDHLVECREYFLELDSHVSSDVSWSSHIEDFRVLSQMPATVTPPSTFSKGRMDDSPASHGQVDLTLVHNVFPHSQPAIASRTNELMLLYISDNGASNTLQCTDIMWTYWNGTNWTLPRAIETNTQAEFSPQVAYDGNGDAIALWERVADPNFNVTNLTDMAAQMEIVWSKWSRSRQTWSTPGALSSNNVIDYAPLLCGPLSDGSVLGLWTRNAANFPMTTSAEDAKLLWTKWNPLSQSWLASQLLVTNMGWRLSQSLAGTGDYTVYAWTLDLDGVLADSRDQQLFYTEYSDGVWAATKQLIATGVAKRNVRVAVSVPTEPSPAQIHDGFLTFWR